MYALNLGEGGRILSACMVLSIGNYDGMPQVDSLPGGETAEENDISNYKYLDGEYVYDPLPKPEPMPEPTAGNYVTYDELAAAIREGVDSYGK